MVRMKMLRKLRIACIVTLIFGIALFFGVGPLAIMLVHPSPTSGSLPILLDAIYVLLIAALCFAALWDAWKICNEIGRDNSFSMANVKSLESMSIRMKIVAVLLAAGAVIFQLSPAKAVPVFHAPITGVLIFGVLIAAILALCTSALAGLIREGEAIKAENDLTI